MDGEVVQGPRDKIPLPKGAEEAAWLRGTQTQSLFNLEQRTETSSTWTLEHSRSHLSIKATSLSFKAELHSKTTHYKTIPP